MHGNLKWFSDPEYSLYCDEGTWKTGYESLGVDIASVCVSKGKDTFKITAVLLHFPLSVNAATLIFISGRGSAISSAKEGKIRFYL